MKSNAMGTDMSTSFSLFGIILVAGFVFVLAAVGIWFSIRGGGKDDH